MSILMPTMSYDPFNSHSYASSLFDPQDHYLQPAAFSPTASYAPTHPFPVDPRWFNNTSLSGHHSGAVTAPLQFSHIEHSDISHPQSQTDQLSLSPSSTLAPIPPLSGFRNRSRSMSNRPRSLTNSSSFSSTRLQRRQTGPARGVPTTTNAAANNASTPTTLPVSPSLGAIQAAAATIAAQSPTSYMSSPSLPHSSSQDELESRAPKRRRLTNDTSSHLHVFQTATGLTEPPQPILSPTHHQQQQHHHHQLPPLHVTHVHGHHHHHHHHDFAAGQTWAGPPTSDHLPHGVNPDQHGYPWAVGLSYYSPEAVEHQHHIADLSLPGSDVSQPQLLPYPSPTVAGAAYFASPASPALDTPNSALSTSHFPIRKLEPESPILLAEAPDTEAFEHSPTEFPPRAYPGGADAKSPWTPVKTVGKIYGSRLEQMPAIEARLAKLEDQMDHYLDIRATQSLKNSQLPGLSFDNPSIQIKPMGRTRVFGGRIWPTALARRVRRTPRD